MFKKNELTNMGDWEISYLPDSKSEISFLSGDDNGGDETAILKHDKEFNGGRVCLILKGDWRKEYQKLKTWDEALAFYKENREQYGSSWSEDFKLDDYDHNRPEKDVERFVGARIKNVLET